MDRSFGHKLQCLVSLRERKDTGINNRRDPLLLHDLCDLLQLRPVGADKQEPVFLPLAPGGAVISGANQGEQ